MIYSGLLEESVGKNSWDKLTIAWINENEKKVKSYINKVGYCIKKSAMCSGDVDDILSLVVMNLYEKEDYIQSKAVGKNGYLISLEDYVLKITRDRTLRYMLEQIKENSHRANNTYEDKDGKEKNIIDQLGDKGEEDVDQIGDSKAYQELNKQFYNLDELLELYEYKRYKYGIDLYTVLLVRLTTNVADRDYLYDSMLELLGVDVKHMENVERKIHGDEMLMDIVKGITMLETWDAIDMLREHVPCGREIVDIIYNA